MTFRFSDLVLLKFIGSLEILLNLQKENIPVITNFNSSVIPKYYQENHEQYLPTDADVWEFVNGVKVTTFGMIYVTRLISSNRTVNVARQSTLKQSSGYHVTRIP